MLVPIGEGHEGNPCFTFPITNGFVGSMELSPTGDTKTKVSERAWKKIDTMPKKSYYFDLRAYRKSVADDDTPYTPANTLISAQAVALRMILDEGIENCWKRHEKLANALRAAAKGLSLELFPKCPANVVTVYKLPEGIDGEKVPKTMTSKYGVTIAGGQGSMKGKIARIASMGYTSPADLLMGLGAFEMALNDCGAKVPLGAGVAAAEAVLRT